MRLRSALPAEEMGRVWVTTPEGDIATGHRVPALSTGSERPYAGTRSGTMLAILATAW